MKFQNFFRGKDQYRQKQLPPPPEGQTAGQNGTYFSEEKRQIVVKIFDSGKPEDLALALGALEIAKDIVKQVMTAWHQKDQQRKGIIVPQLKPNGNGKLNVH